MYYLLLVMRLNVKQFKKSSRRKNHLKQKFKTNKISPTLEPLSHAPVPLPPVEKPRMSQNERDLLLWLAGW